MEHMQQVVIGQRFLNMTGKVGDDLSKALMSATVQTQKEVTSQGMQGVTVVVRQAIITGTLELKVTIILDIMQVVRINPPQERVAKQDVNEDKPKLEVVKE